METWEPVPSLNGKYELNDRGQLRNAKTKQQIKLTRNTYQIIFNGKKMDVGRAYLLWECFGIAPKKHQLRKVPVTVSNGVASYYFDKYVDAAKFLSQQINYSVSYIRSHFAKRLTYIKGWYVTYMTEPMPCSGLRKTKMR